MGVLPWSIGVGDHGIRSFPYEALGQERKENGRG